MPETMLRLAAYGVCRRGGEMLLAHYVSPDGARRHWSLPGGKVEHAEHPLDAVVRELAEETGYDVAVDRLLGVDARTVLTEWGPPGGYALHMVSVFYEVTVVGGELTFEAAGGTTDRAAWIPVEDVDGLPRATIVDTGRQLLDTLPATGHVPPIEPAGLLRS
jgi:ADP-ribose pyrophosphatase YjhB (NUDIX family)